MGLQHDRLGVRVGTALSIGYLLLFGAWAVGYYFIPERALHNQLSGGVEMVPEGLLPLAIRIFGYNLGLPGLLTLVLSRMRAGGYSLGYNVPFVNVILYGLWLGSNSFSVPMPERLAPTLALFWSRSGPYEMASFLLMAAALARTARVAQPTFWSGPLLRLPEKERQMSGSEYAVLALAVLLLAAAAWVEASMWLARVQGSS